LLAAIGVAVHLRSAALAQAPATAQVWDVRFIVDATGPFAAGPTATQVGITMFARVGILPNSSASGTENLGVSRVGGGPGVLRWALTDSSAAALFVTQGRVERGRTVDIDGRALLDTNGEPLAGHFAPFRGSFAPQVAPLLLGANNNETNGALSNPTAGSVGLTYVAGSRALHPGSESSGPVGVAIAIDSNPASLIGDLAPVYRLYYFPNAHAGATREVVFTSTGMSARYAFGPDTFGGLAAAVAVPLPDQAFTFVVPAPGAASALLLSTVALMRRRRRAMP
jgi:hypothetical protein